MTQGLSWIAVSLAVSQDVYFGTTSSPPFRGNQTSTTYDTGTMDDIRIYDRALDAGEIWQLYQDGLE